MNAILPYRPVAFYLKKNCTKFLAFLFLLSSLGSGAFSQPTTVCALTNSTQVCANLEPQTPCSRLTFIVNHTPPSGYVFGHKYEWYANGVLVKTVMAQTTNDNVLIDYIINDYETEIYCDVTYRDANQNLSQPYRSLGFTVLAKLLAFQSALSGPSVINYDNQSAVNYSLVPTSCLGCFSPTSYDVIWQSPSNWTQTGASGNSATFTPDLSTGGTVTAEIQLTYSGCTYSDTRSLNITRSLPTLSINGSNGICTSGNYSIGNFPGCGSTPVYSWSKSSNLNLTGSGNSVTVTPASGSSGPAWVEVTVSSACTTNTYRKNIGIESDDFIGGTYSGAFPGYGVLSPTINVVCGMYGTHNVDFDFQGTTWITDISMTSNDQTPAWSLSSEGFYFDAFYQDGQWVTFTVTFQNNCGSFTHDYTFYYQSCEEEFSASSSFLVYPNPASNQVRIDLKNNKAKTKLKQFRQVTIFDKFGNVKKIVKYPAGTTSATIDIGELQSDIYYIEISDNRSKSKVKLSKTK